MAVICCICKGDLVAGAAAKKRKRLYGCSAEKARTALKDIINEKFKVSKTKQLVSTQNMESSTTFIAQISLDGFVETDDQNALLCNLCDKDLSSVTDLKSKIRAIYDNFYEKLKLLNIRQASRKRSAPCETNVSHTSKVTRQQEEVNVGIIDDDVAQSLSEKSSPKVKTDIDYKSGKKSFTIETPWRKKVAKSIARRNYKSMSDTLMSTKPVSDVITTSFARQVKQEIKLFCSLDRNTILRDDIEAVKNFDWETVWLEMQNGVPSLFNLLTQVIRSPENHKPLLCLMISMILKHYSPKICLVQRAISILLYGNGTSKIVYQCLQPLMVSLSLHGTTKLINRISEDYDVDVLFWGDHFSEAVKKNGQETENVSAGSTGIQMDREELNACTTQASSTCAEVMEFVSSVPSDFETDSDELEDSIIAPPFSPICASPLDDMGIGHDQLDTDEWVTSEDMCDVDEDDFDIYADECSKEDNVSTTAAQVTLLGEQDVNNSSLCSMSFQGQQEQEENGAITAVESINSSPLAFTQISNGYKIVLDNLDRNVRASFQRLDRSTQSFHYVHAYAALDRIDFSGLSDDIPTPVEVDLDKLLPLTTDVAEIEDHFSVLIERMIVQQMGQYKDQQKTVTWHITSKYSTEMSQSSKVVPLGVLLYNENVIDEMAKALDELNKYIPAVPVNEEIVLPDGEIIIHKDFNLVRTPVTGDQVTVARIRGAKGARRSCENRRDRLEGVLPYVEDWHARQVLMMVLWKLFYNQKSVKEKASLYQLKTLINRTAVPNSPDCNMKASEDFLRVVVHAHVIAAAEVILKDDAQINIGDISKQVISRFVKLWETGKVTPNSDEVFVYACDVLTLGLLWMGFYDAIKEGHGDLIMVYWKFLLPVFKNTGRRNYSIEALNLQLQKNYLLSKREVAQLVWSRFINTRGKKGCNMPCDLFMEHLNRRLKILLRHKGSNVQPISIIHASKSIGTVHRICKIFEEEFCNKTDGHPYPSYQKDFNLILDVLKEVDVFTIHSKRSHPTFSMKLRLLQDFDITKFKEWAKLHVLKCNLKITS